MASYTIYEKPGLSVEKTIESAVLIKNQYSAMAFVLPVVWMVSKRLWWVLVGYLFFMIPLWSLNAVLPLWSEMLISLLISLWVSVEAPGLIGWSLERKGYVEGVTLFAEDRFHCETRYIEFKLGAAKAQAAKRTASVPAERRTKLKAPIANFGQRKEAPFTPVIGLFPAPDPSQETK